MIPGKHADPNICIVCSKPKDDSFYDKSFYRPLCSKACRDAYYENLPERYAKTENELIAKAVILFEEIQTLFPKNSVSLNIHDIDIKNLDEDIWEVEANYKKDDKTVYLTANRINAPNRSFDITLFD